MLHHSRISDIADYQLELQMKIRRLASRSPMHLSCKHSKYAYAIATIE
jgi:hypothetical protein